MKKTFIINGIGTSGKDTFISFLQDIDPEILNISSVFEIKKIAKEYFGYNGEKTLENRKLISDLKFIQSESCNGPFEFMKRKRLENKDNVMFFHIREPNEIEKFKKEFNAKTILIKRLNINYIKFGNKADDSVDDYHYDYIIYNDVLSEFKKDAKKFYNIYIKE